MSLPLLPGNTFSSNPGRENFSKSHHFDVCNAINMNVGEYKPGIGGEILPGQKFKQHSIYPPGEGEPAPAWITFDRQVLSFDAYFHEMVVPTVNMEKHRIRYVKIYFYLEDDSIQVIEPTKDNSGIPQGTLIRRHRVPMPPPCDDKFYTFENFNIGNELEIYGKVFHLVNADTFTKNFLMKMGVRVGTPANVPADPHTQSRQQMLDSMKPLRPVERIDTLRQFLLYDRHVLRFECYWDDEEGQEVRDMVLHYYLADDTLEIREVIRPNTGRDAVPVFVKRAKLPKNGQSVFPPGAITPRTVLNVTNHNHILDSLKMGAVKQEFYTDADLQIGNVINVWGRPLKLVACDEFTQQFYKEKYDVDAFVKLENKAIPKKAPVPAREIAPYNGFGSEEDSRANCDSLLPKPPQKDFIKFMAKDRSGLNSHELRFVAKLNSENSVDKIRRFVITYFLSDDTISIFEQSGRNTGIIGGKFLERSKVALPNEDAFKKTPLSFYSTRDFFIGAQLIVNNYCFVLCGADDYALSYMEANPGDFPMSNVNSALQKISQSITPEALEKAKADFAAADNGSGLIGFSLLNDVLTPTGLTQHEILTIARKFTTSGITAKNLESVKAVVQEALRKKKFDDFIGMKQKFGYEDYSGTGELSESCVRTIIRAFRLPLQPEQIEILLASSKNENGTIDYNKFDSLVNYQSSPARAATAEDHAPRMSQPKDIPLSGDVDYKALLASLSV